MTCQSLSESAHPFAIPDLSTADCPRRSSSDPAIDEFHQKSFGMCSNGSTGQLRGVFFGFSKSLREQRTTLSARFLSNHETFLFQRICKYSREQEAQHSFSHWRTPKEIRHFSFQLCSLTASSERPSRCTDLRSLGGEEVRPMTES
jgi:hypothetical protein